MHHALPLAHVALVTYDRLPALGEDDQLVLPALEAHGLRGEAVLWNDPAVDWSSYAAVVLRSTWDYHYRPAEFLAWVSAVEELGVPLFNAPEIIRWNADKNYLRDLERAGASTVPTRWVDPGETTTLAAILAEMGWRESVVKPAISAAARDTWRVGTPAPDDEARFQALLQRGTVLVQPYMDVIATQGELSMIFIDGRFSHAVVKRPRHGDFRVQATHGGVADIAYPTDELVRQGASILRAAPTAATAPLYARVDGVVVDGVLLLMELELIEPSLFFTGQPHGVERFAAALARRIRASATPLPEAARVRSPAV